MKQRQQMEEMKEKLDAVTKKKAMQQSSFQVFGGSGAGLQHIFKMPDPMPKQYPSNTPNEQFDLKLVCTLWSLPPPPCIAHIPVERLHSSLDRNTSSVCGWVECWKINLASVGGRYKCYSCIILHYNYLKSNKIISSI